MAQGKAKDMIKGAKSVPVSKVEAEIVLEVVPETAPEASSEVVQAVVGATTADVDTQKAVEPQVDNVVDLQRALRAKDFKSFERLVTSRKLRKSSSADIKALLKYRKEVQDKIDRTQELLVVLEAIPEDDLDARRAIWIELLILDPHNPQFASGLEGVQGAIVLSSHAKSKSMVRSRVGIRCAWGVILFLVLALLALFFQFGL